MSCITALPRALSLVLLCALSADAGSLALNGLADGESAYYEYFSEGFIQMDLYSPDQPTNQSFHQISDPSVIYNQSYDGFPNDNEFRMGAIEFDESTVLGGTGSAPITGVTLGVATDPFDSEYVNFLRFDINTSVDSFSGSVELVDGAPVSASLDADVTLEVVGFIGATTSGYYQGTFSIDGNSFSLAAEGTEFLDTLFGDYDVALEWDFTGDLYNLPTGDYNADGLVNSDDYDRWRELYGAGDSLAADGNGDRIIDAADYAVWRNALGSGVNEAALSAAPEPTSVCLTSLVVVVGLCRRSKRSY